MKVLYKKTGFYFCFLLFVFVKTQAQTFREVGCRAAENRTTWALGVYKNYLLHSGFCATPICGITVNCVGLWNDTSWSNLRLGTYPLLNGVPKAYIQVGNELYMGGGFYYADNKTVNGIARWDGTEWYPLGTGLDEQLTSDIINTLAFYQGELYAAGAFFRMNGTSGYNCIARWDGNTWRKVAGGVIRNGVGREINSMLVYKGELYVAGYFDQAGSTTAYNIARWDGVTWKSVGNGGAWNGIYDMVVDTVRNVLYVGGDFNGVDSNIQSKKVAMWDGLQWHGLPTAPMGSAVYATEMYHGYLYVGGGTHMFDSCFARWDGSSWELISGPNETVSALQTYKDELYLGGSFTKIGNDSIPALARYYNPDSVVVGMADEKKEDKKLKVYPNPTQQEITIEYTAAQSGEVIFYNTLGQVIKTMALIEGHNVLKIETLEVESGLYLLCVKENAGVSFITRKILIKH